MISSALPTVLTLLLPLTHLAAAVGAVDTLQAVCPLVPSSNPSTSTTPADNHPAFQLPRLSRSALGLPSDVPTTVPILHLVRRRLRLPAGPAPAGPQCLPTRMQHRGPVRPARSAGAIRTPDLRKHVYLLWRAEIELGKVADRTACYWTCHQSELALGQ